MFQITQEHVSRIGHRTRRSSSSMMKSGIDALEVVGSAGAWGYLQGWNNGQMVSLAGVPVDLGVGIGLHLFALSGFAGKHADHLHNLGNGALAFYAGNLGVVYGGKHPRTKTAGRTAGQARSPYQMNQGGVPPMSHQHLQNIAYAGYGR